MSTLLTHTVCECSIVSFISLLSFRLTMIDTHHPSDFISWSLHYYTQCVSAVLYPLFLFSLSGLHRSTYHPSDFISHDLYTITHSLWVHYCILYFSFSLSGLIASIDISSIWLHIMISTLFYTGCECTIVSFISLLSFRLATMYITHLTSYSCSWCLHY